MNYDKGLNMKLVRGVGWHRLVVPEYGVMPLQLIPMLVGFFTYKAATFVETFKELLPDSAKQEKEN
jgi:ATP synthase protein I